MNSRSGDSRPFTDPTFPVEYGATRDSRVRGLSLDLVEAFWQKRGEWPEPRNQPRADTKSGVTEAKAVATTSVFLFRRCRRAKGRSEDGICARFRCSGIVFREQNAAASGRQWRRPDQTNGD